MSSVLLIGKETQTILSIVQALAASEWHCERVSGGASAIRRLRKQSVDVVITDPDTTIDEGLALSEEMRDIRPGNKAILLAPSSTPEEIIAAPSALRQEFTTVIVPSSRGNVLGGHIADTILLKPVWIRRYLVPFAGVAGKVHSRNGR
jgi:DNA-binding NtrC family response regulator